MPINLTSQGHGQGYADAHWLIPETIASVDVHKGETLALLGTNGAGKSTLLRVISGLGVPSRGVVRLHGRTITYSDPELRSKIGIVQLMGGTATFPSLTVDENLRMAGFLFSGADLDRRVAGALARFPTLVARRTSRPRDLSRRQQAILQYIEHFLDENDYPPTQGHFRMPAQGRPASCGQNRSSACT